ncbi:hypothetical protein BaRGS_00006285, partial [Batillaria attramentaria]
MGWPAAGGGMGREAVSVYSSSVATTPLPQVLFVYHHNPSPAVIKGCGKGRQRDEIGEQS